MKRLCFILLWLSVGMAHAQTAPPTAEPDSLVLFPLEDLYRVIAENHPVARQAMLLPENARQELRLARGMFDPKISSQYDTKEFKARDYYTHWKSELKVPVWLAGADLKAGYEQNTGPFLSTENDTDSGDGLAFAGVTLPIGQGLLIDQRRATLQQAEIYQSIAEAEQIKMLNKLILQVAKDYWEWYFAYHQFKLLEEGYDLALFRYQAVTIRVQEGNLAGIDSVEALATLQEREIALKLASVQLNNARLMLSNHVWGSEGEPLELSENVMPVEEPEFSTNYQLNELFEFARQNHPELIKVRLKLDQLEIERRLARENLKPVLNLNYNFLARTTNPQANDFNGAFFSENYKFGVDFVFPIFLRKERAKLQKTTLKIDQTNLQRLNLNRNVLNDIAAAYNEVVNFQNLLEQQEDMVENYRKLLEAERERFRNGQSSVFYVNVREGKLIDTEVKLFKMRNSYAKSMAVLLWAAGMGM